MLISSLSFLDVTCASTDTSCAPQVIFRIGAWPDNHDIVSLYVATNEAWGVVDEVITLPSSIANESFAELVFDKAFGNEFLVDEWAITYLGSQTFAPTVSPTLNPTPLTRAPTESPSTSPISLPPATQSPTMPPIMPNDGVCSKHSTTGWTSGYYAQILYTSQAPNGIEWEWRQCAKECALFSECQFWTLRLTGDKGEISQQIACLLMRAHFTRV